MGLPALNPLEAPAVVCPTCGTVCPANPVRFGKAKVTEVTFSCVNEATNCGWEVKAALRHVTGEGPYALKKEEIEKRRAEAAAAARYTELRNNSVSELIALLPRLKELVHGHKPSHISEIGRMPQQSTAPSATGSAGVASDQNPPAASTTEGTGGNR